MTSRMTATDELRRLLDGRGVEWGNCVGPFPQTAFSVNGVVWQVKELVAGLDVSTRYLTPEQAVEATLGSDLQAENDKLRELVRFIMHQCNDGNPRCDECIGWNDGECVALLRMRELGVDA